MRDQAAVLRRMVQRRTPFTRVIAVTSGKGGVGKSNITANLGVSMAQLGARPAILDGDLGLANVSILFGMNPPYDLRDVLSGRQRISEIAVSGPGGVLLLAGGSGLYEIANPAAEQLDHLLASLSELESLCDVLLVDTGAGLNESVIRLVLSAPDVLLVTTPEPPALADAYGMVKVIAHRSPETRVHVVMNMVRRVGDGKRVFEGLHQAAAHFLSFDLQFLGEVPFDAALARAVVEQTPVVLAYPHTAVSRALGRLAGTLLGLPTPTAGGWRGLLRRMWSRGG
ncbi:MAG: MinD/ParA family protein [Firmicutes bacterium]|nr:MinD/ParA family protein [Bacillota bacterium]